jgi:hypothetical protein
VDSTVTSGTPHRQINPRSRIKRLFGFVALACCTLGACYLGGYLHGRAGLTALRSQLDADRRAARASLESLTEQLRSEQRMSLMLAARRNLDQSVTALDARNFGIAEQQVKRAARWLVAARPEPRLAELARMFETFRLVATEDLGPQRKQLVEWVNQFDQLVTEPNP